MGILTLVLDFLRRKLIQSLFTPNTPDMRVPNRFHRTFLRGSLILSLLAFASAALCQTASTFTISKIEPQIVSTPAVSYSGAPQKSSRPKSWLEIEVSFAWLPNSPTEKYADDVLVNYYVLLANKTAATPTGTLLTGQVTHVSVPARVNDLKSVMYVSPRGLERFFDGKIPNSVSSAIVDIGVTISRQGQVLATKSLKGSGAWWPQFQQTPGFLLSKNETPFASLNSDYYEETKKP